MATKPKLDPRGLKRICANCGNRFYDLNKRPIVCPACDTEFTGEIKLKTRRGRTAAANDPAESQVKDKSKDDEIEEDDAPILEADDDDAPIIDADDDDDTISINDLDDDDDDDDNLDMDDDLGDLNELEPDADDLDDLDSDDDDKGDK